MKINLGVIRGLSKKQRFFAVAFALVGVLLIVSSLAATSFVSLEAENYSTGSCASKKSDSMASGGEFIEFSDGTSCKLDHSGKTIPITNYAIPTGAIFMSPGGTDKNSGSPDGNDNNNGSSVALPVKTITRAIALVPEGGTIVMRGGEYRDWHSSNGSVKFEGKSFTIQAYPGESPWFNGADIVSSGWASAGTNIWSRTWDTPDFCGGQYYTSVEGGKTPFAPNLTQSTVCAYWDAVRDNTNVAGDPQNVFINDVKLAQVPTLAQVSANTFYYDWGAHKIYIGQSPTSNKVELSKRPQALMLNKGQYALKGIGFKRYGSGAYPEGTYWFSGSTVLVNSPQSVLIENTVFADNAGGTLSISKPNNNSKIVSSIFAHNGGSGLGSNGSRSSGGRNDFTIEGSVFNSNNDEKFDQNCGPSCAAANVKMANMVGFTVKNSVFENAQGKAIGLWCDVHCSDGVIVNNLVQNNGNRGIFYEISEKGIIASNLVIDNGTYGISVYSATTKVYNNTVITDSVKSSAAQGIIIADDSRCATCTSPADYGVGPDTTGIELVNNIVVARNKGLLHLSGGTKGTGTNTAPSQFYNKFDHNAFHRTSTTEQLYFWADDNGTQNYIKSSAAFFTKTGWDKNAIDIAGGSDPFFVNRAGNDFRVRSNSVAYNTGQALPADVANAIGVQSGTPVSRGALSWSSL